MITGVIPIVRQTNGCDYHRIYLPLQNLGFDFESHFKKPEMAADTFKVLYFNRMPLDHIDQVLKIQQQYGFKILMDLDDTWILNTNHLIAKDWNRQGIPDIIKKGLKAADHVIVTTARLASIVSPINPNVTVIPNALPYGQDQFVGQPHEPRTIRQFIYAGGSTHFWDIQELKTPFTKLNSERLMAEYVLAGYNDENAPSKTVWDKIENSFNLNKKLNGYIRKKCLPLKEYMNLYDGADVALIPLEENSFTAFKSNLKVLEAGCKYIPAICSNVPPYNDEPRGNVLMFAKNARGWYDHMKYCIKNPTFVKESGLQLGEYVRENYDLTKWNVVRKQIIDSLIAE